MRETIMRDTSQMSVAELKTQKIVIEEWMDRLALQLDDANKELARRYSGFRGLCLAPPVAVVIHPIIRRDPPNSADH
jgi:hypothetical protein